MQYFVDFVSPGSAKADSGCDEILCQKYWCQKLLKSHNPSLSYNQKCPWCFISGHSVLLQLIQEL